MRCLATVFIPASLPLELVGYSPLAEKLGQCVCLPGYLRYRQLPGKCYWPQVVHWAGESAATNTKHLTRPAPHWESIVYHVCTSWRVVQRSCVIHLCYLKLWRLLIKYFLDPLTGLCIENESLSPAASFLPNYLLWNISSYHNAWKCAGRHRLVGI